MGKIRNKKRAERVPFSMVLGPRWYLFVACLWALFLVDGVFSSAWSAQVQAVVDRTQVGLGESVTLEVTIEGADGEVDVSGIDDFNVISRGSTSSYEFVNGRSSRKMIYNFILIPLKEGRLTIPALSVDVEGKPLRTEPIVIEVQKKQASGQGDADLLLKAEVSDRTPYIGQPITCTFTFYNAVQVIEARFDKPEFRGFSVAEVDDQKSGNTVINGKRYFFQRVVYVLTPRKEGPLTIEPAQVQCKVSAGRSRRGMPSPFDDFFNRGRVEIRAVQSDPLTLDARALPPVPADRKFSGLVGTFQLSSHMERTDLAVGDSVTYTLTLEGKGNLLEAPNVRPAVPEAFKHYDDAPQEEIGLTMEGYQGRKIFRTALVPIKAGEFVLPEVRLTYFDPQQAQYLTIASQPVDISVGPSEKSDSRSISAPSSPPGKGRNVVTFTGRDILPLKEDLNALESRKALSPGGFLIWLLVPAVFYLGATVVLHLVNRGDAHQKRLLRQCREALKAAGQADVGQREYLSKLHQALVAAIRLKSRTLGASLTWSEAEEVLRQSGAGTEMASRAAKLLEEIETANYSGGLSGQGNQDALLTKTQSMVGSLLK